MDFYNTKTRFNFFDNAFFVAFHLTIKSYAKKNYIRRTSPIEFYDIRASVIACTSDVSFAEINQLISRIQDLQAYGVDGRRDSKQRHDKFIFTTQFQKIFEVTITESEE